MTLSTQTVAEQWKSVRAEIIATETGLSGSRPLVDLIMEYLNLPSIEGWITEWTGEHGREVVECAVIQAQLPLTRDMVSLVVQYLQKSDIFGLGKVEEVAGGPAELTKLIGKYNPEKPLPFDIDDEMQAPLTQHFDAETLKAFHEYRTSKGMPQISKMTELYSLYWGPASMTPNIAEKLAMKHGTKFDRNSWKAALKEHGDKQISIDCWIAFPSDVFGRSKTFRQQEALIPVGFEFPHFPEAIFCPLVRFACTRERILPENPYTFTLCPEETQGYNQGYKLAVGGFDAGGLCVHRTRSYGSVFSGVAPLRKFCIGH